MDMKKYKRIKRMLTLYKNARYAFPILPFYLFEKLYYFVVIASVAISIYAENWHFFQRAGAIIVAISIITASKSLTQRLEKTDILPFAPFLIDRARRLNRIKSDEEAKERLEKFKEIYSTDEFQRDLTDSVLKTSVKWAVVGTLINGFGDLIQTPYEAISDNDFTFVKQQYHIACTAQLGEHLAQLCNGLDQL